MGLLLSILAVVLLVVAINLVAKAIGRTAQKRSSDARSKRSSKPSRSWIVYLVLAVILSFWSGFAALFLLMILVIVLRNPTRDLSPVIGKREKSTALRVYTWLFLSSLLTVPFFLILIFNTYSRSATNHTNVLIAIAPVIVHAPLLLGLTSNSRFVYRHTQQGILLIAIRAGVAALALSIGDYPYEGLWLFLLGNGSLWFFGSIWGWTQVSRGQCWWMKQKNEHIVHSTDELASLPPHKLIEQSREYINQYDSNNAKKHALAAFRRGDADIKRQAVQILEVLDEVESF